jgi:hypothetical protein
VAHTYQLGDSCSMTVPTMPSDLGPPTTGVQDSYGNVGTSGQVLSSKASGGVQWTAASGGAQGPQGPAGSTGGNGSQGPQGTQGSSGSTGGTGSQGPQGTQGVQGTGAVNQGPQGTQGPTGTTGNTGSQGPQGTQGATGTTGNTGNTGSQGPQGTQGTGSLFSGVQGPPVYAIQGTQFSCTAQTPTSVQGCQVTGLAANATYKFEFLLGVQGVGIQGYQFGFQCTQSGASQGGVILAKVAGGPQGTVATGTGHQSYMATGFGIQGPQMCGAVGNAWMTAEGIFTTNSVAGSVFGVQVKGTQATITPAILANSYLRLERLA